ncbi:MAG TPA: hypothetical protein ENK44_10180 [Caldithrix abyssi]|uniref:Zinc-finger domain-containing protein n=1 Tax=Caldithrix abyssi TaxID=187145 RepID=A0A7V4U139_CALAY|nr:hypothetical protein [Caldithrix abyssi]
MMDKLPHKERIKQLCDIMGEDLDGPACQAVLDHINTCPTCKVYYDTVKKTILLCKENDCPEELPDDVNARLMKVLDLEEYAAERKGKKG